MTLEFGPGCSVSERRCCRHLRNLERTRRGDLLRGVVGGVVVLVVVDLGEDVKAAGQQLAGDRDGGDVPAAAGGALGVEAGERRAYLGRSAACSSTKRTAAEPCLGDGPWRMVRSQVASRRSL
jgi:hypothetical protein